MQGIPAQLRFSVVKKSSTGSRHQRLNPPGIRLTVGDDAAIGMQRKAPITPSLSLTAAMPTHACNAAHDDAGMG